MLLNNDHRVNSSFAEALERYLGEILHDCAKLTAHSHGKNLPHFLENSYEFYESPIRGRRCVFLVTGDDSATPSEIEKHVEIVRKAYDGIVIFAAPFMKIYHRNRLIKYGVPFVVPGNQLYIPELAMDLRERVRSRRSQIKEGLSPAAQAILFYYLLQRNVNAKITTQLAKPLGYTTMSVVRAFDDLIAAGIAEPVKHGRNRHIMFEEDRRKLFIDALPYLRNPVRARKYVRGGQLLPPLKMAGESALAELTALSWPLTQIYAVASAKWKAMSEKCGFTETNSIEGEYCIETWRYDPAPLASKRHVDPLSLYVQFQKHEDPRMQLMAEELFDNFKW